MHMIHLTCLEHSVCISPTGVGFRLQLRCSESIESPKIVRSFVIPSSSNQADLSCHALFKLVYASTDYFFGSIEKSCEQNDIFWIFSSSMPKNIFDQSKENNTFWPIWFFDGVMKSRWTIWSFMHFWPLQDLNTVSDHFCSSLSYTL